MKGLESDVTLRQFHLKGGRVLPTGSVVVAYLEVIIIAQVCQVLLRKPEGDEKRLVEAFQVLADSDFVRRPQPEGETGPDLGSILTDLKSHFRPVLSKGSRGDGYLHTGFCQIS